MSARRPLAGATSASTTDFPAGPGSTAFAGSSGSTPATTGVADWFATPRNFYISLTVVALIVGALSLLVPSTPSYDPWSWLLWGHEIVHGSLTITTGGTSWKPLPMIFTIPFALFGRAAPDLWLVVARAGAFAAVVMVFRLSYRLTRQVGGLFGDADAQVGRLAVMAPALLAGAIGAVSLALSASGGFVSSNTLGYSEGFAAALLLIAIERLLDGKPRQAFAVGFFVALDRPEIWLFWGALGLWLLWKDPAARVWVVGSAVLVVILWFVPVDLGCGSFSCSVSRAVHPRSNSLAFASSPFEAELSQAAWPTMLLRIKVVAALLVIAVAVILWREWRRGGTAALATPANRARLFTALMGIGGLAWFVVIAVMTQIGFSGNNRYLVLGSALVDICAAVGYGWAATELTALAARRLRGRDRTGPSAAVAALRWAATGVAALVFVIGPNWIGSNLVSIPRTHGSLVYQAHLRQGMTALVDQFGGASKVLACGSVMTEGFQVPMVAWILNVPTTRIQAPPTNGGAKYAEPGSAAPNVILQTRDTRSASLLPLLSTWPSVRFHYVGTISPIHMFTNCAS
ncbi:MAG TPA: hypothetical protein VHX62_18905 [Solirubrobacteraceae bacterium]|nr:hypothetical protein [Solirubrobacteraceae bacterium]